MIKKIKQRIYRMLIPAIRVQKFISWIYYLKTSKEINLVVGAGPTKFEGWFSTDKVTLDVTDEKHFRKYFTAKKINKILAEHVLEHLTDNDLKLMAKNFYKYSADSINIRIAVPDGFHTDKNYIDRVKPGGTGAGADDHKHLFNYKSLSEYFTTAGFTAHPLDYWDEQGNFHSSYKNDDNGYVSRSLINDERNVDGKPVYTSLIIDFKKK